MNGFPKWLIYGAYGYTGRLIAEEAVKRGLQPVLAGRNGEKTRRLAENLDLDHRIFSLDEPSALRRALEDADLVLHAAGPYSRTFRPMAGACLEARCHYLDITGEISVLEAAHAMDDRARDAGVLMVPAVGLDVVPTDCVAARAAEALPDASRLDLALHSGGGPSRGTARTMVERMGEPGKLRDGGRIVDVRQGSLTRSIPFRDRERLAVCIPWGDVSTAYHSTGIPDIRVFMTFPPSVVRWLNVFSGLLRIPGLPALASWVVKHTVDGPSEQERQEGRVRIWCEAGNGAGKTVRLEMMTPNGYTFTARSAVSAVERIAAMTSGEEAERVGFQTPSSVFGAGFVDDIEGVEWIERGSAVKRELEGGETE